jgi:hypothetical protein
MLNRESEQAESGGIILKPSMESGGWESVPLYAFCTERFPVWQQGFIFSAYFEERYFEGFAPESRVRGVGTSIAVEPAFAVV